MRNLILGLCLLSFGCKNNPATSTNKEAVVEETASTTPINSAESTIEKKDTKDVKTTTPKKSEDPANVRLVVDFYSDGSGSDYKSIIAYEDSLGAYSARLKKTIDYLKKPWGREGETEFCLKLNELNPVQQTEFIAFTRKFLKTAKFVNIFENHPCKH